MSQLSYGGQAQACVIRVARLTADGAPLAGADNLYVSEGLVSLNWSPDVAGGEEIDAQNGCGADIIYYQAPDRVRKLELDLALIAPEPDLLEMLEGGTIHGLTGDVTGFGLKGVDIVGGPTDVSIELWERVIVDGSIAGYARYVFPRTRNWVRGGGNHENDVLNVELSGIAVPAGTWGDGPGEDWSSLSDQPVNLYDWAIETQTLPEPTYGAQELTLTP